MQEPISRRGVDRDLLVIVGAAVLVPGDWVSAKGLSALPHFIADSPEAIWGVFEVERIHVDRNFAWIKFSNVSTILPVCANEYIPVVARHIAPERFDQINQPDDHVDETETSRDAVVAKAERVERLIDDQPNKFEIRDALRDIVNYQAKRDAENINEGGDVERLLYLKDRGWTWSALLREVRQAIHDKQQRARS